MVVLAQADSESDHFAGLDAALHERGLSCDRLLADQAPVWFGDRASVVVVRETQSFVAAYALRQARRVGAVSVLLMDGIVEWRNTFVNPRSGPEFLRPAPVDVVACAGELDRRTLEALGNDAVATGLPRLSAIPRDLPRPTSRAVMVATANRPAFDERERARLLGALGELRDRARERNIEIVWRLTGDLDAELGVASDRRSLRDALAAVRAVVTTPSTLMVESMLAGRPTAMMHVQPTPCWQPCAWAWCGAGDAAASGQAGPFAELHAEFRGLTRVVRNAEDLLESIVEPTPEAMARQARVLALLHHASPAALSLAGLCAELAERPRRATHGRTATPPTRSPVTIPRSDRPRVVSCVHCDGSPVGGVQTWAFRLADAFARENLGYDVRTLLVTPHPHALPEDLGQIGPESLTQVCVYDPTADHTEIVRSVRDAIGAMNPSMILPNFTDLCYMAATLLRPRGVRTLAIAHTDDDYYRALMSTYDRWEGVVGVSRVCSEWLAPLARSRPLHTIPYGVPISERPRRVEPDGPIKIVYSGRMVQPQKRIFDLLGVVDGLERRGVSYVLHMVGDGAELGEWRRQLETRHLTRGHVEIHGRRDPAWVQRFLGTVDVSVLVSEFEGTSVSMLEAMGAGVVPVVTRVRSGVEEWVRDGVSGALLPIGAPDAMAERLAGLARDRSVLARMGREAWETARARAGISVMARAYREVFDRVMMGPMDRAPTDLGLRPSEASRWRKQRADDTRAAESWIRMTLGEAGYTRLAFDRPEPGCDAVLVRTGRDREMLPSESEIAQWRSHGLGVAFAPDLRRDAPGDHVRAAIDRACRAGSSRIAVFGIGKHTRALASLFYENYPIVGFIDDHPPAWGRLFGLPVVTLDRAASELAPDAVLLSSDAWERQMWERSTGLRRAGVRVLTLYGNYDTEAAQPTAPGAARVA